MKKIVFFAEEINKKGEVDFAVMCVGVMDEEFIYAKRISNVGSNNPEFIQVLVKDTEDCTSAVQGLKKDFVSRSLEVFEKEWFEDPRINTEPTISEECMAEIMSAIEADKD